MAWILDANTIWYLVLIGGASIFYLFIQRKIRLKE